MKLKRNLKWLVALGVVLSLFMWTCASLAGPAEEAEKTRQDKIARKDFIMGTGSVTGTWYPLGGAIAKVVAKYLPGYRITPVIAPTTTSESSKMIQKGEWQIGCGDPAIVLIQKGEGPWKGRAIDLRGWFYMQLSVKNTIALEKSGVRKLTNQDLKGKRISLGFKGTMEGELTAEILKAHGINLDEVKIRRGSTSEAVNQLRDQHVDMMTQGRALGSADIMDLSMSRKLVWVQPTKEGMDRLGKTHPYYFLTKIPPTVYDKIVKPDPCYAISYGHYTFLDPKLPDKIVYDLTKVIYEHLNEIHPAHVSYKTELVLEKALSGMPIPPHPGAVKYYLEKNVPGAKEWAKKLGMK